MYTITSAAFANADHTTAILQTEEAGAVLIDQSRPDEWAALLEWGTPDEYVEPEAPRRMVRKSLVQQRLIDAGLMDRAYLVLTSQPAAFARWFAPDHPEVYADDPDALAMLAAIGAVPAVIMAP
jgi:hypothetical protein